MAPEAQVIFIEMVETIKRLEAQVSEPEAQLGMTPDQLLQTASTSQGGDAG